MDMEKNECNSETCCEGEYTCVGMWRVPCAGTHVCRAHDGAICSDRRDRPGRRSPDVMVEYHEPEVLHGHHGRVKDNFRLVLGE